MTTATNLTPKQEKFCTEFLVDLNATQAAIRAGYAQRSATSQAFDLLRKPDISARIAIIRSELAESTGITPARVLRELDRIAFLQTETTRDRITALSLIGKHLGMFVEPDRGGTNVAIQVVITQEDAAL